MRYCQIICLLLSSVFFHSCSSSKTSSYHKSELTAPLLGEHNTALYKASINVFGNYFSGLVLLKHNAEKDDYNIVMLSEVGLTICEFYSHDNEIVLRKASSLFKSKKAQSVLAEDLSFLVDEISEVKAKSDSRYKSNSGIIYSTNSDGQVNQIRKRRLVNGVRIDFEDYKKGIPTNIYFKNKGIGFSMKLKLIKVS